MEISQFEDGEHFFWFAKENRVNCPEIGFVANKIAKCYEESTGKQSKYIEHIVCNCYMAWLYRQSVAFFSKNECWVEYNSHIKSKKDKFSVISFRSELKFLETACIISTLKGKKCDWNPKLSMASRFVPTTRLETEFDIAWETHIEYTEQTIRFKQNKFSDTLTLSECKKDNTIPEPTQAVIDRKEFLERYNNFLRKHLCTYSGVIRNYLWDAENKYTVTLEKEGDVRFIPQLTANYSGAWDRGGRFYAHSVFGMVDYQQLSKEARETIKINNERTAEVDYSCLHLSLMYAKCGKQLTKDAYAWCSDRLLAKKITIICLNNNTYAGAIAACRKWLEENGYDTYGCKTSGYICNMLSYHSEIRGRFFKKGYDALSMQNDDSAIMQGVLKALHRRNIPALPVHDSVIVPESRKSAAVRIMAEQYKAYTGFEIEVK
jgi:hypothetical protein